jgi:hypothetical protein
MQGPAMDDLVHRKDDNNDDAAQPEQWKMYFSSVSDTFFSAVREIFPGGTAKK